MTQGLFPIVAVIGLVASVGCSGDQRTPVDTTNLPRIEVDFELTEQDICGNGTRSPEIRLTDLPRGAVSGDLRMTDLEAPRYKHWNETIPLPQAMIPSGKGINYRGPACPPNGHHYRISIIARNSAQQPVAYGEKTISAEWKSRRR